MAKQTRKVSKKRSIRAEDLFQLRIATSVAISPDESKIAYTVEKIDPDENKYFSHIHVLDRKTGESSQFTHGHIADGQPVWSPDGTQIAFLSTRKKKTGIYIIPATGGAERQIFEREASISNLQWHPDGKQFVFGMQYHDSHFITDEKEKKEQPVYRHITRLFFRLDGSGFLHQDKWAVYALTIETASLRKISKSRYDLIYPTLSADGKSIAYVSNRRRNPDKDNQYDDLFIIPFKGGKEKRIETPEGPIAGPVFSPDGKSIAYLGHDNPKDGWGITNTHIWKVNLVGKAHATNLLKKFDRMAYDQSITDTGDFFGLSPITWSHDSKRIYFLSSDTGNTNLFYVPARGGRPTRIYRGKCHIKQYSLNGNNKTVAMIRADINNPGDIITCPATYEGEKKATTLTNLNRLLHSEIKLGKTRDLMFKSFDGTEVQGWLVYPPNFNPKKKYPSILQIHGGPRAQYAHSFMHEMQYLAAKGYVVFYTNPRGGSGRGETWAEAIKEGWGDLDYRDCMAAADYLEQQKFINKKKIGVTGGSYGGYMTNWMIGHTNRFKAAVTQRSVVDLKSFFGSSDIGWSLEREFDGTPWDNAENYKKCSPITYFKKVTTPVLIIHSEQDLRCNIEQAEQMFAMLKYLGKKVEMVRFPEEPHGLSRHGRPDRRIARLDWISKWFDKYLK